MSKVHDRILEILVTTTNGAQQVKVTGVRYYRDRGQLDASNPFVLSNDFSATAAASPIEGNLGELLPPPSVIRVVATISA